VNSTSSDPFDVQGGYSPVPEEMLYPKGMTPDLYADTHTAQWQAMHPNAPRFRADAYKASVLDTANGRNDAIEAVKEAHPEYSHALDGLLRQLYKIGNNRPLAMRAINHYAGLLSPEAGAAIKQRFAHEVDRLWPTK
jgi:hypothetical protein